MRKRLLVSLVAVGMSTGCLGIEDLPPDTLDPQVQITSPVNNSTVGGGVSVEVNAADDYSVEVVRIFIDGTLRGTFYARPYQLIWSTIALADNSTHTIRAEAVDPSSNMGTTQITVTVVNGQTVSKP